MPAFVPRASLPTAVVLGLIAFTLVNPVASLDLVALLVIGAVLLSKILGPSALFLLLAWRPALDWWRDVTLVSYESFSLNLTGALSLLLLGWLAVFLIKERASWGALRALPGLPGMAWLLGWFAFSFTYSFDKIATVTDLIKLANLFGLFLVSALLYAREGAAFERKLKFWLLGSAIVPLGLALYQLFSGTGLNIDNIPNRIFGTFAHPNVLAIFSLLLGSVLLDRWLNERPGERKKNLGWYLLGGGALGLIILSTYTRIAWIGLALMLLIVAAARFRRALVIGAGALSLAFGLFYPLNQWLVKSYGYDLKTIPLVRRLTTRDPEADSVRWRVDLTRRVLPLIARRPLLGYGYGAFPRVWDDNKGVANLWDTSNEAHDDWLRILFETGVIGLVLFLGLFAALLGAQIRYARRFGAKNLVFIASLIVYLVLSASDNMLRHTPVAWWLWSVWGWWAAKYRIKNTELK